MAGRPAAARPSFRFRDVVYLALLCGAALVALNARLDCAEQQEKQFPQGQDRDARGLLGRAEAALMGVASGAEADTSTAAAQQLEALRDESRGLRAEVLELRYQLNALEKENKRLNQGQEAAVEEVVEGIKQRARESLGASRGKPFTEGDGEAIASEDRQDADGVEVDQPGDEDTVDGVDDDDADDANGGDPRVASPVEEYEEKMQETRSESGALEAQDLKDVAQELETEEADAAAALQEEEPVQGDDEEEENDEEEEPVLTQPAELGFQDRGGGRFVLLPQVSNKTKLTFRTVGTKFLTLFHAWEHAGWKHKYDSVSPVSLYLTKPMSKVPGAAGKMLSQISKSSCIGGTKGAQLRCKVALAEKHGCDYTELGISPAQYNLREKADCERFFAVATQPENADKMWIGKDGASFHGKNIKVYKGLKSEVKKKYGKCAKDKKGSAGFIMMEYVAQPQLMEGRKFDLRTYLLIASTKPFLVFYHKGFIRRSMSAYSSSSLSKAGHITNHKMQDKADGHFWGFEQLSEYLEREAGYPRDFMGTEFRAYAKHATNYVFQAARSRLRRRPGAFMLFGLDWMIDQDRGIHFLEANGNPSISNYTGTGLGPAVWTDMAGLLTKLHRDPERLGPDVTVASGFRFGNWELVFNEAEEVVRGQSYEPCSFTTYAKCTNPDMCPIW